MGAPELAVNVFRAVTSSAAPGAVRATTKAKMPPSIAMEGYLEKRIQRPFGIVVWQKRHVMLTPSEIVVRNPQKKDETKRYLYESVVLAPFSAAPSGRVAFALLDAEEQETKLTLAAETKFEHGRWIRAVAEARRP